MVPVTSTIFLPAKFTQDVYQFAGATTLVLSAGTPNACGDVVIDGATFDGLYKTDILVSINGVHTTSVTFRNCKFIRYRQGVVLLNVTDVKFDNCTFDNYGVTEYGTAINIFGNSRNVTVTNCKFNNGNESIIASGTSSNINITGCQFIGQWQYLPKIKGLGGNGNHVITRNSIEDVDADFSKVATFDTARVSNKLCAVTSTYTTKTSITFDKTTEHSTAVPGDVVVCDDCFGVITAITDTQIDVEGWQDRSTLQPTWPKTDKFAVHKLYVGAIGQVTKHKLLIYFDSFCNMSGTPCEPPPDSKYEICRKANYQGVHTSGNVSDISVTNSYFYGGWSDQISLGQGTVRAIIRNNMVKSGQDTGITVNGTRHIVTNNNVTKQGCNGIWANCTHSIIADNIVDGWSYTRGNTVTPYPAYNGIMLADCNTVNVHDNYLSGTKYTKHCIVATDCVDSRIANNICNKYANIPPDISNDIALCGVTTRNCIIEHNGQVDYPDGYFSLGVAPGQMSNLMGSGMPEGKVKAATGSTYNDGASGLYSKDAGTENTGWHRT